jgi:ATP-dependent Clp protease, protease subunit
VKKPKDNLSNLLQVKNLTNDSADLYFYGDIVSSWWGAWDDTDQYPEAVKNFLDEAKGKNLNIYINSGGGSVFAGMAIYNMIKRHIGYKKVYVDGLAASIASIIALAGDELIIPSNAYFMIHKPWSWGIGSAIELRKMADSLDVLEEGIINVYSENLKPDVDIEVIRQMVQDETWLTGDKAAEYFNIETSTAVNAAAYTDIEFKNMPKALVRMSAQDRQNSDKMKQRQYQAKLNLLKLRGAI